MTIIVHKFLQAVVKVQRCIRDYLKCKISRIFVLTKIWDKIEYNFIKVTVEPFILPYTRYYADADVFSML